MRRAASLAADRPGRGPPAGASAGGGESTGAETLRLTGAFFFLGGAGEPGVRGGASGLGDGRGFGAGLGLGVGLGLGAFGVLRSGSDGARGSLAAGRRPTGSSSLLSSSSSLDEDDGGGRAFLAGLFLGGGGEAAGRLFFLGCESFLGCGLLRLRGGDAEGACCGLVMPASRMLARMARRSEDMVG